MARFTLYAVALAALLSGCKSEGGKTESSTSTETQIGNQIWMTENLKVSTFRNGDPIMEVKTLEEWNQAFKEEKPAFCYSGFNPETEATMGKLYNRFAVADPRGLAPEGWHIATRYEWDTLNYLVPSLYPEEGRISSLKAQKVWDEHEEVPGSNASGFNAYPNDRISTDGFVSVLAPNFVGASWWTDGGEFAVYMESGRTSLLILEEWYEGLPVRCVRY